MLVVLDTNIYISEFVLNSNLGAAVRFFLWQKTARIALPEVVRLETERHLQNILREHIGDISKKYRQLLSVFGSLREMVLPDDAAIESRVAEVFSNLGVELVEVPFSLESARASFLKTVNKVPPSDRDQQFKDGVLWADCVELLKDDDVFLVTSDKAFYENREYSRGLARNLRDEASIASHSLKLLCNLAGLLEEIKTEISLDEELLAATFMQANRESINSILNRNQFALGRRLELKRGTYAIGQPNLLSIEFTMEYECLDASQEDRTNGLLTLRGDGMYDVATRTFNCLRNHGEKLSWLLKDGTQEQARNYVLFADSGVFGHREVVHAVRRKLD